MRRASGFALWLAAMAGGCSVGSGGRLASPVPVGVTQPVPVNEVQSAAFWIHPTQPEKSLLLVTNEKRGLEVHDTGGLLLKHLEEGIRPIYVDVLYEFPLGDKPVDLVLASCMRPEKPGVRIWRVDAEARKLVDANAGAMLSVFDGQAPAGLCTYHSPRTGKSYFFVTLRAGQVEQHELTADDRGVLSSRRVRAFALASEVKSCIVDDEMGSLYVSEDDVGVWRFDAEPGASPKGECVIRVGENGLVPNVKGPALYGARDGRGYLLVTSQGRKGAHTCIKVYERQSPHRYCCTIEPEAGAFGAIDHSSGLAVTNAPTIGPFAQGALAINDQINPNASEDFKLYRWADVARSAGLIVDTQWSPRPSRRIRSGG